MQKDVLKASYGESIGLILEGTGSIKRGDVLSADQDARITREFDAHVFWFEGVYDENEAVKIKCATQESESHMILYDKFDPATMDKKRKKSNRLDLGEVATVKIRTEKEVVIDPFSYIPEMGRFVIEKEGIPVGGGIVA
jgi:sulfate adenylyltransferase subunit 1 (EFTu-like GTPase family)